MSTSPEVNSTTGSGMRKRTCDRPSCAISAPSTQCCEASCLVEIARRDCKNEPGRCKHNTQKLSRSVPLPADEVPCESHYLKAKEAYGAILDNLGCICKSLLSLQLDSCCSPPQAARPSATSRTESRLANVRKSLHIPPTYEQSSDDCSENGCCGGEEAEIVVDIPSESTSKDTYCDSSDNISSQKPEAITTGSACCSNANCCGETEPSFRRAKSLCIPNTGYCADTTGQTPLSRPKIDSCNLDMVASTQLCRGSRTSCTTGNNSWERPQNGARTSSCSKGTNSSTSDCSPAALPKPQDFSAKECCPSKSFKLVPQGNLATISSKNSCDDKTSQSVPETGLNDCSGKKCCVEKPTILNPRYDSIACSDKSGCTEHKCYADKPSLVNPKDDLDQDRDCSAKSCCDDNTKQIQGSCTSEMQIAEKIVCDSEISASADEIVEPKRLKAPNTHVDLESGDFEGEHIVLSIRGMTCTGCERKLYNALSTLPAISNIKTSLVLAQAEFDLYGPSTSIDTVQAVKIIEKMTGFTCAKMNQSGEELELVVDGSATDFITKDPPYGVIDITALDKNTIRVVYQPRIVGARELLADPFFHSPKVAPVAARPLIASGRAHVREMLFKTILAALLTIPVLVMAWASIPKREVTYGAVSLALATIIQVYIAGPFYTAALKALIFSRMIEMDLLVVISTTTAYVYSIIAYAFLVSDQPLSTGSFFETSTLLVTLIMLGRLVSAFARQRAVESMSIESLQSSTAILIHEKSGEEEEIDARLLQYQDIFKALPDTSIATDGTVLEGYSEVDESMITGEATLVVKKPGSPVIAGSINHSGTLTIRLARLPGENTIKTISLMVDEAKSSKAKIQEVADRVASYFVPAILAITVIVFVIWVVVGKLVRRYDGTTTSINAMTFAISALIVSCPCAIGLAVPMVLVIASGVAAKHGVIFKTANTIEIARNLSHVIFDKTGTLTQGKLSVEVEKYPSQSKELLSPMILALTSNSKHPVSVAIALHFKLTGVLPGKIEKIVSVAGCGVEATWQGTTIRAGNPHWLGVEDLTAVKETLQLGLSMFCVSVNGELAAIFGLKDLLRPDARRVMEDLKQRSIHVSIVSGDNEGSVKSIARDLGIPESHVRFRCSPADKQAYVKQQLSAPKSIVMFCGDGTNDAIALAQASIGMHIDGGTDIAQSAADAVLVRPVLTGIPFLIDLSKAFYRRVTFNFAWSFIYNTFAILLAAGAFPHARIPPAFAGLGEIVSVLPVIAIGLQLKWVKLTKSGA